MKALLETEDVLSKHADYIANQHANFLDDYIFIYIKKCPSWMPYWLYKFIISKVFVMALFKKAK